jgi:hypothetical protein
MPHTEIPVFDNTIGFETISVTNAVKTFTEAQYKNVDGYKDARVALVTCDGSITNNDGIRWTTNGTAPVAATTGHFLPAAQSLIIRGATNIVKFKAIRETSNSVDIHVSYYR